VIGCPHRGMHEFAIEQQRLSVDERIVEDCE